MLECKQSMILEFSTILFIIKSFDLISKFGNPNPTIYGNSNPNLVLAIFSSTITCLRSCSCSWTQCYIAIQSAIYSSQISQHWYVVSDIRFRLSLNLLIACLIWWFNIGSFVLQYITIYHTLSTGALYCTTWGTLL